MTYDLTGVVEQLEAAGLVASLSNDEQSITGGTSRDNKGGIRFYSEAFVMWAEESSLKLSINGPGQTILEFTPETVDDALTIIKEHYA